MIKTDPAFKRPIPEDLDSTGFVPVKNSTYAPMVLSEVNVFQLARTGNTIEQVAKYFRVSSSTITGQYHEAFLRGKSDYKEMPQRMLYMMMDKLAEKLELGEIDDNKLLPITLETIKTANRYNGREREMLAEPVTDTDVIKTLSDKALLNRIAQLTKDEHEPS